MGKLATSIAWSCSSHAQWIRGGLRCPRWYSGPLNVGKWQDKVNNLTRVAEELDCRRKQRSKRLKIAVEILKMTIVHVLFE
jgi:hypothetical protein